MSQSWAARLPFHYGWLIVCVAFVTMAVAVSARTSFSLLVVPLTAEFGWDLGLVAGAFSTGFIASVVLSPTTGRLMDRYGPRLVLEMGVCLMTAGLLLASAIEKPWHLSATLGLLVGAGANLMTFNTHSLFLPNWFVRRRGLAISIAFSGVGVGAITLLPWLQTIISEQGWRASCWAMGLLVLALLGPLNLLVRRRPEDIGLLPDGTRQAAGNSAVAANIVDSTWAATNWTLARAIRTRRFWWIALGFFCAMFAWYAVQVHQTKYLVDIGFSPLVAAWALGSVSVVAIPGQLLLGALSDRIGREKVWSIACCGFGICYGALIALEHFPSTAMLYVMVVSQGAVGYALASIMGPIVLEIFEGPHFGLIFGTLGIASAFGAASAPWVAGLIRDATGSYMLAFATAIACCIISGLAVWMASPRHVRFVPGQLKSQV